MRCAVSRAVLCGQLSGVAPLRFEASASSRARSFGVRLSMKTFVFEARRLASVHAYFHMANGRYPLAGVPQGQENSSPLVSISIRLVTEMAYNSAVKYQSP